MPEFWSRLRNARLFQVLLAYLVVAWVILQVADVVSDSLQLPPWVAATTLLILLAGLPIVLATAWLTANPPAPPEADGRVTPRERVVHRWVLPHFTWRRSLAYGALALGILLLVVIVTWRPLGSGLGPGEARADVAGVGLAVLPFSVRGADTELWGEGMVDLLSTNLDGVAGLRTIDPATILARLRGGADADLADKLQVARDVHARYALIGSTVAAGRQVRVSAELHDIEADTVVARVQAEGSPDSVLALVDALSVELVRALATTDGETGLRNAQSLTTSSLDALRAYLEAERLYRVGDLPGAADAYERAIREDSTFALAYWGLSWAQGWVADSAAGAASDSTFARLVRLSDRLPERTRMFVEGDSLRRADDFRSIAVFESAVARYPDDPEAWYMLGEVRFHNGGDAGVGLRERVQPFLRAIALDPTQGTYYYHPIPSLIGLGDTTLADSLTTQFLAHTGDSAHASAWRTVRDVLSPPVVSDPARVSRRLRDAPELAVEEAVKAVSYAMAYPAAAEVIAREAMRLPSVGQMIGGLPLVALLEQGRARELIDAVTDGRQPPFVVPLVFWFARYVGADVEPELIERYLDPHYLDGTTVIWAGLDAFTSGDRERLREAIAVADERVAAATDAQREGRQFVDDALRALDVDGPDARRIAADSLAAVLRRAASKSNLRIGLPLQILRDVLADLYTDTGRPREAIALIEPFVGDRPSPLAALRLARARDALGEHDRAAELYAIFLEGWENADPGLELEAEARNALARLGRESRS